METTGFLNRRLKKKKKKGHTWFVGLTGYTFAIFCLIWYKACCTVPRAFWLLKLVSKAQSDCGVSAAGGGRHSHRALCGHWQCQSRHYSHPRLWCLTCYAFGSFRFVLDQTSITIPRSRRCLEFVSKAQHPHWRGCCLCGATRTWAHRLFRTLSCWHFSSLASDTLAVCGFVLQTWVTRISLPIRRCLFRGLFTCRKTTYCRPCIDCCACDRLCRCRGLCFYRCKSWRRKKIYISSC